MCFFNEPLSPSDAAAGKVLDGTLGGFTLDLPEEQLREFLMQGTFNPVPAMANPNGLQFPAHMMMPQAPCFPVDQFERTISVPVVGKRTREDDELDLQAAAAVMPQKKFRMTEEKPDVGAKEKRKPRFMWTPELHAIFLEALSVLDADLHTPKNILRVMKRRDEFDFGNLNTDHIKSHLQKWRLGERKEAAQRPAGANPASSPAPVKAQQVPPPMPPPAHHMAVASSSGAVSYDNVHPAAPLVPVTPVPMAAAAAPAESPNMSSPFAWNQQAAPAPPPPLAQAAPFVEPAEFGGLFDMSAMSAPSMPQSIPQELLNALPAGMPSNGGDENPLQWLLLGYQMGFQSAFNEYQKDAQSSVASSASLFSGAGASMPFAGASSMPSLGSLLDLVE